ncbi:asparagine synthetase B family protein [Aestuariibaculum suncheonense]|uniref:asparagine synthase (glutamine-hydrolyzing) n=1 Tax=Aestuariibaculum suncheonense TaxID=1028745 RepID=A0A8J6QA83_9FLAO|nr:asparagine synthetase B family protein [Aestuariibaculum suncheonense]MBD0836993.1 asparagine synthetase B family protein [Aestuariibaculum suncheonense]
MNHIQTPIIPITQQFAKRKDVTHDIHKEALCVYVALGFFLGEDAFYKDERVLQSGRQYTLDAQKQVVSEQSYFKWYHTPRSISFKSALDEYTDLFEDIVKKQSLYQPVILPLSGGLDSRTQAVALDYLKVDVTSYSYSFKGGYKEHALGKAIADTCGFKFDAFEIPEGYLWKNMEELAQINHCYSDFTHPRQMAILNELKQMQGAFSLGHWGDVLFDSGIKTTEEDLSVVDIVYKKIVKPGGLVLASMLWEQWGLHGGFEAYLKARLQELLDDINIENKSAKVRVFKSMYWAPRWTSVNLSVFQEAHPVNLPYYDDQMCRFICELPEAYLANRQLQIEYIKQRHPEVAKITWQAQKPYNLYNFHKNKSPWNLPCRVTHKLKRSLSELMGRKCIQRNWELQFLGKTNDETLKHYVFDEAFLEFVGGDTVQHIYNKFNGAEAVKYAHPLSMLLTLSVWRQGEM